MDRQEYISKMNPEGKRTQIMNLFTARTCNQQRRDVKINDPITLNPKWF